MDDDLSEPAPAEYDMPCCCAKCGAAFEPRTQRQLRMLARLADLGLELAEAVAEFPIRTRQLGANDSYHFEVLSRGVRRSLALECKITADARKRHAREAHGAPAPRERDEPGERAARPLPLVTTEDVESVVGPEPVVRETPENLLGDARERLLDRFVETHTPAVVAASICRDFKIEEDISVFLEPVPTRDDPWVRAEAAAVRSAADVPADAAEPDAPEQPSGGAPPSAKGRDPP
jgi:hypothetical protein